MALALVVDDDADMLDLVSLTARRAGYDSVTATSGEQALELLASGVHPDVIVLDVVMPGVTGLELCRLLRRGRVPAGPSIVLLSANAHPMDQIDGLDAGADLYLTKPFSPRALVSVLEELATA